MSADKAASGVAKVAAANTPTTVAVILMGMLLREDVQRINDRIAVDEHSHRELVADVRKLEQDCAILKIRVDQGDELDAELARRFDQECRTP